VLPNKSLHLHSSRILSRPLHSRGARQILDASKHGRKTVRFALARTPWVAVLLLLLADLSHARDPSVCFGTTSNGYLKNGWKLPASGPNFAAYSTIGRALGRTFVHSTVYSIVVDAYARTHESAPNKVFVYGETGRREGGEFKPHKTHRNGLSVDFMVPVVNSAGDSVPLATNVLNKWGYDLEFDSSGRVDDIEIDAEAMAEHLYQLHLAAQRHNVDIWRVIFAPDLQPLLRQTTRWPFLSDNLSFSTRSSWVRHDQHYHLDFEIPCEPSD